MNITGLWEGTLDGTNGTFNLDLSGHRNAASVTLRLTPSKHAVRTYPGTIDPSITCETEMLVRGKWQSSLGTKGTFKVERRTDQEPSAQIAAKRIAEANAAFIIMAFGDKAPGPIPVVDIRAAIKRGCEAAGVKAHCIDEIEHSGSITTLILEHIKQHRFIISDLTHERPNVYYEVGFAHGIQKEVVLTAYKGTQVHFDVSNHNVIFYSSGSELESRISKRLRARINNIESRDD